MTPNDIVNRWKVAAGSEAEKDLVYIISLVRSVSEAAHDAGDLMNKTYGRLQKLIAEADRRLSALDETEPNSAFVAGEQETAHKLAAQLKKTTDFRAIVELAGKMDDLEDSLKSARSSLSHDI